MRHFSLYLALRYLRPKRTFVSVITVISVLGVAFGVTVLMVVIAVMAGFHAKIRDMAMSFDSHIEVGDTWGRSWQHDQKDQEHDDSAWRNVLEKIRKNPNVASAAPTVQRLVLVRGPNGMSPAFMWGLDEKEGQKVLDKYKKFMVHEDDQPEGKLNLNDDDILLDVRLANSWNLHVGDKVTLYSPNSLKQVAEKLDEMDKMSEAEKKDAINKLKEITVPRDLTISGIISPPVFQDGTNKIDVVIVPLHVAKELLGMGDGIGHIGVELKDPYKAGEVQAELQKTVLPPGWASDTWFQKHEQLFATVQNELEMMYFVLFLIVVVAAFCVMNTMITVTVQKRREIGIIAALGARFSQISWVFLHQGMMVGAFGATSGIGMGLLIVYFRNNIRAGIAKLFHHEIFAQAIYGIAEIPAKVNPWDVTIISCGAFLLCTVAALVPAVLAARIEPAKALRD